MNAARIESLGSWVLRYGLVLVIGWIGLMKFTAYEAQGIEPLVAHSPLMGWIYHFLSVRQFSVALGVVEVAIAILIALRHISPKACAIGSAAAVLMFLTTLTFLFFNARVGAKSRRLSSALGIAWAVFAQGHAVLLGAAIWSLGEALSVLSEATHLQRGAIPALLFKS